MASYLNAPGRVLYGEVGLVEAPPICLCKQEVEVTETRDKIMKTRRCADKRS